MRTDDDLVVLLDDDGTPIGTADREGVHVGDTPLHLAFSCYVRDDSDRLLLSRRAVSKRSWPGVWTNSFCGHPRPGEDPADAVHRYAHHELGITVTDLELVVPDFRYRAVDASGIVENEICPVWSVRTTHQPRPHPDEVAETRWVTVDELHAAVDAAPWALSPWMLLQVPRLEEAGWAGSSGTGAQ